MKQRIACALVSSFVSAVMFGADHPKLLVGIIVDGLKQETLDMLQPHLEKNGFNRFLRNGVVLDNINFGTNVDATAATAIIMTGASPRTNGISGENIYEPDAKRSVNIFTDNSVLGNFTNETFSPSALRVSTLSDEIRIAGAGVTYVHAIAPTASQSLILGSHAGNSAIWLNEKTGNWASSTYYREMPNAAMNANRTHSLTSRIDTMQWTPSRETAMAASLPDHLTHYPFKYSFSSRDSERFARFANSPFVNSEITGLALNYISSLELGKHDGTDVLNVAYTLQPYEFSKTPENRYELYDSYIKLDKSLSKLFSYIDSTVGRDNAVIYLAGTPGEHKRRKDDNKWKIPTGEFSTRHAVSILNLYLVALYGNGEWVTAYNDGQFFLNDELAKSKELDLKEVRRNAADCLVRMSGIDHAYTIDDIVSASPIIPNADAKSRNTVINTSGDLIVEITPGWALVDDYNYSGDDSEWVQILSPAVSTFMIYAPGLTPERIGVEVDARAIAPTVASILHIRSPNGAGVAPVSLR